ncbi:glutamine-hydrolyzing carbamoyl-phosphate synthase small subunit [Sphingomonas sp. FW199]|uniref:glutamine-hydrolyzing carbamoyl-phosphate synthase small subunit n=1 Tax=Sphingomonas sp. FW199 TaxID=3400217 RepID=UPI003CE9D7BB
MAEASTMPAPEGATGVLVLASGDVIWGHGFGAEGSAVGEVCFHTAMTGYQEIMTDPSFAGQMICFTFPHIGNVGANPEDFEADDPHALGMIVREMPTQPSNFRSVETLSEWMAKHNRIGLAGVDTRALTRRIRGGGAPNGVIAHSATGEFDIPALLEQARAWPGLEGMDLAKSVTRETHGTWDGGIWRLGFGYEAAGERPSTGSGRADEGSLADAPPAAHPEPVEGRSPAERPHVVAVDYGAKRNIYRNLVAAGAKVSVVPAEATYDQIMALNPDGVFLSNGPGDPAATGDYALAPIKQLLEEKVPVFGICLGHQLLALAAGAKTTKMFQGHRGANHPVKRLDDGVVEITSMNHGFAVDRDTLPANARETHVSLFDGSNCGIELTDRPAFSVQYHPEASPGPQDSFYLFQRFVGMLRA